MSVRGRKDEQGFTLTEIILASTLSLLVMLAAFGFLNTSTKTASAVANRSINSANAREAIDALEANLRFATGVLACGPTSTSATGCLTPSAPSLGAWSTAGTANLFVQNAAGGSQQGCVKWTLSSLGLREYSNSGANLLVTIPGVMAWAPPVATATVANGQTTGFTVSLTLPGLVIIDLLVNSGVVASNPKATVTPQLIDTPDAVSVHDFIAPDNLLPGFDPLSGC